MSYTKFEYKQEMHQGDPKTFMPWVNRHGVEGWELVTYTTQTDKGFWYFLCTFKRNIIKSSPEKKSEFRTDRTTNDDLKNMLIGLCTILEAKHVDRTIDSVPNLRKWWKANRIGKKPRDKTAKEIEMEKKEQKLRAVVGELIKAVK